MKPVYQMERVVQAYNGRTVVDVEELSIPRREIFAIVGPSGAGKSTLLRLLTFLERPSSGRIVYLGRDCDENWPDLKARRQMTLVFQRPLLLRGSVADNVAFGLGLRGVQDGRERIATVVEQLGLTSLMDAPAATLSGGEMQRVALARALVLEPEVLLLDEPTANLDPRNIKLIESMVKQANEVQGTTVVMVTHNVFQARRLAHRVALMLSGRLVEVSEVERFFSRPKKEETAAFVSGDLVY